MGQKIPPDPLGSTTTQELIGIEYVHPHGLRGGAAGDLLDAELSELSAQLLELLGELVLVLPPELTGLDLGRLERISISCCLAGHIAVEYEHTMVGGLRRVVVGEN
jgi:hypothetical protein